MSGVGKRGPATFSIKDCDYTIEFDMDGQPIGKNMDNFSTYMGVKLKSEFSYHIPQDKFEKQKWEDLWTDIKKEWHIQSHEPKDLILKNARKRHTNWRSTLTTKYVKKNLTPFGVYKKTFDKTHWDDFVKQRSGKEFEEKSEKASRNARLNTLHTRLGRHGFAYLNPKVASIWAQLVLNYKFLKNIEDLRSQRYIVSRAKKIWTKKKKECHYELLEDAQAKSLKLAEFEETLKKDGSYNSGVEDPLTRLLGCEHGGRSPTTSSMLGRTKVRGGLFQVGRKQSQNKVPTGQTRSQRESDSTPDASGMRDAPGGSCMQYPSIKEPTLCQLLYQGPSKREKIVGVAYLQPTTNRIIHTGQMAEGYVKIQVSEIDPDYMKTPLPPLSCYDQLEDLGDTIGWFIQWPLSALKLLSTKEPPQIPPLTQPARDDSCYEPPFLDPVEENQIQYDQMDTNMIENFDDDEFVLGALASTQHDVHVSEEQDRLFSCQEALVKQPPAPKMSKLKRTIQDAIWKIENLRPKSVKTLAARLTKCYDGTMSIEISWPNGMYPTTLFDPPVDYVEYEAMLQFLANGLLDASILHWCQMYLYDIPLKTTTQVAYFNTQKITGEECMENFASVKEHLQNVYDFHEDKRYFLAPFFNRGHWVLFIVSPKERKGWILDSLSKRAKKNKSHYPLSNAIEVSFGRRFTWNMVKCKQQDGSWECGYLVIRNMFEFVISKQNGFPNNIWNDTTTITEAEIDMLVKNIMHRFFVSVFNDKSKT